MRQGVYMRLLLLWFQCSVKWVHITAPDLRNAWGVCLASRHVIHWHISDPLTDQVIAETSSLISDCCQLLLIDYWYLIVFVNHNHQYMNKAYISHSYDKESTILVYCFMIWMMAQPTFLSYEDLRTAGILTSEARSLQYCIDVELLRPHQYCDQCHIFLELKSCPPDQYTDGCCWICPGCDNHKSVRANSILYKRSIPFSKFLHLLWMFCNGVSVCDASRLLSMNTKTVRSLYKALRQCMAEDLMRNSTDSGKIGGPGHIIEVDESKFGKPKYNRGRLVVGKWVLGGYVRTTGDCFLVECTGNRRNHHTLLRLIKAHVRTGTIILTDKWKGYKSLSRHGFTHVAVNHRRGFVTEDENIIGKAKLKLCYILVCMNIKYSYLIIYYICEWSSSVPTHSQKTMRFWRVLWCWMPCGSDGLQVFWVWITFLVSLGE